MAKRIVTFGEIMLRLAPEGYYRFTQATSYGATYGGGEAEWMQALLPSFLLMRSDRLV